MNSKPERNIEARPLTPERWDDLTTVFGPHGAYSGCWCMYWRITRREFERNGNAGNRASLKRIVDDGAAPGVLFYEAESPIGWCAIGPRSHYPALNRSPVLRAVDERAVWSIVCFYLPSTHRRRGLFPLLIGPAVRYAADRGATTVEAYPDRRATSAADAFMGVEEAYRRFGFVEVARRRDHRPILRYEIGSDATGGES